MKVLPRVWAGGSDTGSRAENQDAIHMAELPGEAWFAAVADGMGGHNGGAYASRRALEVVSGALSDGTPVRQAVSHANRVLNEEGGRPDLEGMGTTLVGILGEREQYLIMNVGDSRAYRIKPGLIEQVSFDHSFVAEAVRDGTMSEEAASASEWGNMVTRSLGGEVEVETDVFGPFVVSEPEIVLLCSDGLYKSVPDSLIVDIVLGCQDAATAAQALLDVAFRRGSDDNISVVLVELGNVARSTGELLLPPPIAEQKRNAAQVPRQSWRPPHESVASLSSQPPSTVPAVGASGPGRRLAPALFALVLLVFIAAAVMAWTSGGETDQATAPGPTPSLEGGELREGGAGEDGEETPAAVDDSVPLVPPTLPDPGQVTPR